MTVIYTITPRGIADSRCNATVDADTRNTLVDHLCHRARDIAAMSADEAAVIWDRTTTFEHHAMLVCTAPAAARVAEEALSAACDRWTTDREWAWECTPEHAVLLCDCCAVERHPHGVATVTIHGRRRTAELVAAQLERALPDLTDDDAEVARGIVVALRGKS